jgi:hypothetical protein
LLEGHKKLNHIKIIDFGEAIIAPPEEKLTEIAGTMAYVSFLKRLLFDLESSSEPKPFVLYGLDGARGSGDVVWAQMRCVSNPQCAFSNQH